MFTMIYADEESVLLFSWQKGARFVWRNQSYSMCKYYCRTNWDDRIDIVIFNGSNALKFVCYDVCSVYVWEIKRYRVVI